jgi:hypothetical protein
MSVAGGRSNEFRQENLGLANLFSYIEAFVLCQLATGKDADIEFRLVLQFL